MSKVLVIGRTRKLEGPDEERLWKALEVPPGLFTPPTMSDVAVSAEKPLPIDDTTYISRLMSAFTQIQHKFYPDIRASIFSADSWRGYLDSFSRAGGGISSGLLQMPAWVTNGDYRQQGRTFALAVAYIEKALSFPGLRLTLEDHAGPMADDILDSQVKDLIEVEPSIQRRSSFANRGELVIFSEEHLKSIIAP